MWTEDQRIKLLELFQQKRNESKVVMDSFLERFKEHPTIALGYSNNLWPAVALYDLTNRLIGPVEMNDEAAFARTWQQAAKIIRTGIASQGLTAPALLMRHAEDRALVSLYEDILRDKLLPLEWFVGL